MRPSASIFHRLPVRRGVAMVIAMLFVVLFTVMSLGFYSSIVTGTRVAGNERKRSNAFMAAESGLAFMNAQLYKINLTGTDVTAHFDQLAAAIQSNTNASIYNTQNMRDADDGTLRNPTVKTFSTTKYALNASGVATTNTVLKRLYIPGGIDTTTDMTPRFMNLGGDLGQASIVMTLEQRGSAQAISVAVVGRSGTVFRSVEYDLSANTTQSSGTSAFPFPNGSLVTYSKINASNGVQVNANVLAFPYVPTGTNPATIIPASVVGGSKISSLSYVNGLGSPTVNNGGSIGTITKVASAPAIPSFSTDAFKAFVPPTSQAALTSQWQSGKTFSYVNIYDTGSNATIGSSNIFNNVRIKAGSNVTFGNGCTVNGVVYIEPGAKVSFACPVNGVIVSDSSTAYDANNVLTIANGTTLKGVGSIDMTKVGTETTRINTLKSMFVDANGNQVNASMIMAPNFTMSFQGGMSMTNAAAIVGYKFNIANGSSLSLAGILISLVNTTTDEFTIAGGMTLSSANTPANWPGFGGSSGSSSLTYSWGRSTYEEVLPWNFVSQP